MLKKIADIVFKIMVGILFVPFLLVLLAVFWLFWWILKDYEDTADKAGISKCCEKDIIIQGYNDTAVCTGCHKSCKVI